MTEPSNNSTNPLKHLVAATAIVGVLTTVLTGHNRLDPKSPAGSPDATGIVVRDGQASEGRTLYLSDTVVQAAVAEANATFQTNRPTLDKLSDELASIGDSLRKHGISNLVVIGNDGTDLGSLRVSEILDRSPDAIATNIVTAFSSAMNDPARGGNQAPTNSLSGSVPPGSYQPKSSSFANRETNRPTPASGLRIP